MSGVKRKCGHKAVEHSLPTKFKAFIIKWGKMHKENQNASDSVKACVQYRHLESGVHVSLDGLTSLELQAKNLLCFRERGTYEIQSQIESNYSVRSQAGSLFSCASRNDFEHCCLNACCSLLDK